MAMIFLSDEDRAGRRSVKRSTERYTGLWLKGRVANPSRHYTVARLPDSFTGGGAALGHRLGLARTG